MDNKQYLIYLISCVLHDRKPELPASNISIKSIYTLARFYGVENLALRAAERMGCFSDEDLQEWRALCEKLQYQNIIQKMEYHNILKEFTASGIKVLPLKGCVLKPMYPLEADRKMGDIDLLIGDGTWDQARSVMEKMGYTCKAFGVTNHDFYEKKPWMNVELHRSLFSEKNEFCRYFQNVWDYAAPADENTYVYTLPWDEFYIYLMAHFAKHCRISGSGIRSIVDIYIFLQKHGSELEREYIGERLREMGIWEFACDAEKIADKWFSGALYVERDCDYGSLEALILRCGIYGSGRQEMMNRVDQAARKTDSLKTAKWRYTLSCIFAGYDDMKYRYPVLERFPFLITVLWISRGFRIVLFDRKKIRDFRKGMNEVKGRQTWINEGKGGGHR